MTIGVSFTTHTIPHCLCETKCIFNGGAELFAGECWASCAVDGSHPNDLGFYRWLCALKDNEEYIESKF